MLLKNKIAIENWLNNNNVKNYTLIPDEKYGYIVDVFGEVNLNYRNLVNISVKFNKITGSFSIYGNKLESLEGCPNNVSGYINIGNNYLKNIDYFPDIIGKDIYLHNNQLSSLNKLPKIVNGDFLCDGNKLISLEGCPEVISGDFNISDNKIKNLNYFPKIINGDLIAYNNKILLMENPNLGNIQNVEDLENCMKLLTIITEKEKMLELTNKIIDLSENKKKLNKI